MTQGITFFNFGGGCMVRLLVSLHSLRDHYKGPITLQLAKDDQFNIKALPDLEPLADIQWFDLERLARRNLKSVIKPMLFKLSPYDSTLMLDGDLLVQRNPQPLLDGIDQKGFLVTRFSTWNCDGGRMRGRVIRCQEFLDKDYVENCLFSKLRKVAAINIGVMGWKKGHDKVLADWEKMTMNLAGQHIADEVACQVVYPRHQYFLADETWNSSCIYGAQPAPQAAILHFHGNKHTRLDRPSSRRWLKYLALLRKSGKVSNMGEYLTWGDKALSGRLKDTPRVLDDALRWED